MPKSVKLAVQIVDTMQDEVLMHANRVRFIVQLASHGRVPEVVALESVLAPFMIEKDPVLQRLPPFNSS
ncbi:hypothetical protein N0V91_008457 [Didymella pomorum]|uniref:Uncharacterized protein n=1 Tax=Didymella pomorum TaxID=749634 RepID=A0A9W8Z8U5_9PLEO|nr:hypothetical protein N0V91_008457 [Didymella pomorum]